MVVRIAKCGAYFCGTIESASTKSIAEARRGGVQPLIGWQVLSGLRPDGRGNYKGKAFDPRHGLGGIATVRLSSYDALTFRGCAVVGLMCKEQYWRRVK